MIPAKLCDCFRPQVFSGAPDSCHKCGRTPRYTHIYASTWRLALAIAEVMIGKRRLHDHGGRRPNNPPS